MNNLAIESLLETAIEAARAAGGHALRHWSRRTEVAHAGEHDVKLRLDSESQEAAEELLRRRFPGHAVLGEEHSREGADPYEWVVDPIDGTVNFFHGMAQWCASVAVRHRGQTLAGAVYAPALDELFTATLEGEACLNGTPVRVSEASALDAALLLTGLSEHAPEEKKARAVLSRLAPAVQKVRIMGAAALDLCAVACGRAEAYYETSIFLWDIAAGELIVRRAGGRAGALEQYGPDRMRYLASNGLVHDALARLLDG